MRFLTSSFLDEELDVDERIYRIWYVVFAVRYWRFTICNNPAYELRTNFITLNAYLCIEIQAHGLINILEKFRKQNQRQLFLPKLFGSQSCEGHFRATRSTSSRGGTRINFTAKDYFIDRCRKVDANIRLMADGLKLGLKYPRARRPFDKPEEVYQSEGKKNLRKIICLYSHIGI